MIDLVRGVDWIPGIGEVLHDASSPVGVAFNFLGDWLRDFFDPRLRQVR